MLILTRRAKRGDLSIVIIGDEIEVEVIRTEDGDVCLGITAPDNLQIVGGLEPPAIKSRRKKRSVYPQ